MRLDDPIWDDPFHAAAWQAFAEGVVETGGIPDSGATKQRAYQIYEQGLTAKVNERAGLSAAGHNQPPSRSAANAPSATILTHGVDHAPARQADCHQQGREYGAARDAPPAEQPPAQCHNANSGYEQPGDEDSERRRGTAAESGRLLLRVSHGPPVSQFPE